MMTLLLDSVKVGPDAQHGREQHAPLHVAAKAGMLNTLFALQEQALPEQRVALLHLNWQKQCYNSLLEATTSWCLHMLISLGATAQIQRTPC